MGYEVGVLLDGMAAEWHTTADGQDFAYIKGELHVCVCAVEGMRMGNLPQRDEASARRGWERIQRQFVTTDAEWDREGWRPGRNALSFGDVRVLRWEKTQSNDVKGVGAFLLEGSEREQTGTEALGQGKTALVDA